MSDQIEVRVISHWPEIILGIGLRVNGRICFAVQALIGHIRCGTGRGRRRDIAARDRILLEEPADRNIVQVEELAVRSIHIFVCAAIAHIRHVQHRPPRKRLRDGHVPVIGERLAAIALLHCIDTRSVLSNAGRGREGCDVGDAIEWSWGLVFKRSGRSAASLRRFACRLVAEYAEPSAEHGLAIAEDIVRDPATRRVVEHSRYESGERNAFVDGMPLQTGVIGRAGAVVIVCRHPDLVAGGKVVKSVPLPNVVEPEAIVNCQPPIYFPRILRKERYLVVGVVRSDIQVLLLIRTDIAQHHVSYVVRCRVLTAGEVIGSVVGTVAILLVGAFVPVKPDLDGVRTKYLGEVVIKSRHLLDAAEGARSERARL